MRKHIVSFIIVVLILGIIGAGAWTIAKRTNTKTLYQANCEFVISENSTNLATKINQAQTLYNTIFSENRLALLQNVITKIDGFEKDLNSYLVLTTSKLKENKSLSKSYTNLTKKRNSLITDYDEYITRMSGDLNADGNAIQKLYNDIFNKTVEYLYKYNSCFKSTTNYVFKNIYKAESIKPELYSLYSLGVDNLLNNISNNKFGDTSLISRLNNGINLTNGNLYIVSTIDGGEFSLEALKFQEHFNKSNLTTLVDNFNTYYATTMNPNVETAHEKLAVYYAKLILEI